MANARKQLLGLWVTYSYKYHPGIWFTLYAFESWFWFSLTLTLYHVPYPYISSILFFWTAMMFYGIVYYHARWLDTLIKETK